MKKLCEGITVVSFFIMDSRLSREKTRIKQFGAKKCSVFISTFFSLSDDKDK